MAHIPCSKVVVDKIHMKQLEKSTGQMHKLVPHCYNHMIMGKGVLTLFLIVRSHSIVKIVLSF